MNNSASNFTNQLNNAETKLNCINTFFTAYGAFITGVFFIAKYFFGASKIVLGFCLIVLIATYYISYSKKTTSNTKLWNYIHKCADDVGPLNPSMLIMGFILEISNNIWLLIICILLVFVHIFAYIMNIKRVIALK